MSTPSIILYDTNGKSKPWNPMSLKIRYALEYKHIPYRTIWLEYPEIEPTLRGVGAKPSGVKPDGLPFYTVPVIADEIHPGPDGKPTLVTDSWIIAEYLDEIYPDRPLFPGSTTALQWLLHDTFMKNVVYPSAQLLLPRFYDHLNESSRPYFRETREGYFKKTIAEMCPKGSQEWDDTWKAMQKAFDDLATALDKNGPLAENPYVMGKVFSYADITIAVVLYSLSKVYPAEWEKIRTWNGGRWGLLADKCSAFVTET